HDLREMIILYTSLKLKLRQAAEAGKKPGAMDDRFSAQAIEAVLDEVCTVLSRDKEELRKELLPE
ncbi:MAG: hypothetical protein ILO68_02890, partial [Clostridia bacterium]|nr:hypothetical protein [Clostridia bacterium]